MSQLLKSAIVRICTSNREYVGLGVLVSARHILTCAHVVADALGLDRTQEEQPVESVYFDFPYLASGHIQSAKVVLWQPVQLDQSTLSASGEDTAFLELDKCASSQANPVKFIERIETTTGGGVETDWGWRSAPVEVTVHKIYPPATSELEGHSFEVFGIPAGNPQGVWADGILLKELTNGWIQIQATEQTGYQIERGFSGSPVWDKQLNKFIGITVATDPKRPQAKVGFIIPISRLLSAFLKVEELDKKLVEQAILQYEKAILELCPQKSLLKTILAELSDSYTYKIRDILNNIQRNIRPKQYELRLTDEEVEEFSTVIRKQYQEKVGVIFSEYKNNFSQEFLKEYPFDLTDDSREKLRLKQQALDISDGSAHALQKEVIEEQEKNHSIYSQLIFLLKAGKWKEADCETWRVMRSLAHSRPKQKTGLWGKVLELRFSQNEPKSFSCQALKTIDYFWVKCSNGHFGFSVQRETWLEISNQNRISPEEVSYQEFAEKIGWCQPGSVERKLLKTVLPKEEKRFLRIIKIHEKKELIIEEEKEEYIPGKWLSYEELNSSLEAPRGHFPAQASVGIGAELGQFYAVDEQFDHSSQICKFDTTWYGRHYILDKKKKKWLFEGKVGVYYLIDIFRRLLECEKEAD